MTKYKMPHIKTDADMLQHIINECIQSYADELDYMESHPGMYSESEVQELRDALHDAETYEKTAVQS